MLSSFVDFGDCYKIIFCDSKSSLKLRNKNITLSKLKGTRSNITFRFIRFLLKPEFVLRRIYAAIWALNIFYLYINKNSKIKINIHSLKKAFL